MNVDIYKFYIEHEIQSLFSFLGLNPRSWRCLDATESINEYWVLRISSKSIKKTCPDTFLSNKSKQTNLSNQDGVGPGRAIFLLFSFGSYIIS